MSEGTRYQALPTSEGLIPVNEELEALEPVATRKPPTSDPVDVRIRWIYFLLGCATLLPWNATIIATPFFTSRLVDTPLRAMFGSYQSSVFTVSGLMFQAYCTVTSKLSSPSRRALSSILVLVFFIFLLFLSTYVDMKPSYFFSFVLFSGVWMSAAGSYLQVSVYAGAALLGGAYMQATVAGQAAVAVAVSIVQLVSSAVSVWDASRQDIATFISEGGIGDGKAEELSARSFFGVSVLFMTLTFVAYMWLTKQPSYKTSVGTLERNSKLEDARDGDAEERLELVSVGKSTPTNEASEAWRVFTANITFMFSVTYVFIVTLAIYPSITATILPTNPGVHPLLFVSTHFLAFNGGDLLGRYICSFPSINVWSARKILVMSLARTLFIPIILLCNVQHPTWTPPIPPVISSDILYMLILVAMGVSNGYVATSCFLAGASLEHNHRLRGHEDVDMVAILIGFSIIVGLAVGSLFSFGVRAAICDCDPFRS